MKQTRQNKDYYQQKYRSNKNLPQSKQPEVKKVVATPQIKPKGLFFDKNDKIILLGVILFTFIVYFTSLFNGWIVNWDDGGYIHEHDLVHSLTFQNFITIFNPTTFYKGNYHPLTTYVYALEYSVSGLNPFLYHLVNLIFHLLNVYLVFYFLRLITNLRYAPAFVALFFGIHPMHVESVAWISELKDVMYTFFFLLSLIYYYNYFSQHDNKKKNYILAFVFFFLSMLSKSAASCLPIILFVIDYYKRRKINIKLLIEKIPFFVVAIAFGVIAIFSQKERGAIQDLAPLYSITERFFIVCHNTCMYLYKMFIPIDLIAMYAYPDITAGMLPIMYYISPVIVAIIVAALVWSKRFGRGYIFGGLFFFFTIALVLQILPVGGASISERYTYVPYIGSFLILGFMYDKVIEGGKELYKKIKPLIQIIVIGFIIFFSIQTWIRIQDWKDGVVLFTDLIKKCPNMPFAYNNRGYYFYHWEKNYDMALEDFNHALAIDPAYYQALSNKGVVLYNIKKYNESIDAFTNALKYKKDNVDSWIGRANAYSELKRFDLALPDYDEYIKLKKDDAKSYVWRGIAEMNVNQPDKAIVDFDKCLSINPNDDEAYYWKGLYFINKKDYNAAITFLDKSISINPKRSEVYSWRGLAKYNIKQFNEAIPDFTKALELNPKDGSALVNRSNCYYELKQYSEAWQDINAAGQMGYPLNKDYFMKLMALVGKK